MACLRQFDSSIRRDQATSSVRGCVDALLLPREPAIFEVKCNNAESRTSYP